MYEEDHGIISNKFYDSKWDDKYKFSRDSKWYNNTEPIWIAVESDGKKAGAYMWVGKGTSLELQNRISLCFSFIHRSSVGLLQFNNIGNNNCRN